MKIHFLGANRQVTGSRYCLETDHTRILIDCGMFQERPYLSRNWDECPLPASSVDAVLLTHAHLDHCGLLPKFVREGFAGPIYATPPTIDLATIILRDSAKIQEEDAAYKKKRHRREKRKPKHPEIPLYTAEDADRTIPRFGAVDFAAPLKINDHATAIYHLAGHILGAAWLEILLRDNGRTLRIVFSGDLGQWRRPLIRDPELLDAADVVVMESTYGDRDHPEFADVETQLADVINRTFRRGGHVIIPTFAIERAQELMFHIGRLVRADRIPDLPVFLDSPMAVNVTDVFRKYRRYMDEQTAQMIAGGEAPFEFAGMNLVRSVEESKAINSLNTPAVIMAASGMCTGGRIKHHLRQNITKHEATILFVGYQAHGTLGRLILEGRQLVRIHGREWPVRAHVAQIHGFSAHGDRGDLMRWLASLKSPPKHVCLTHGEEESANALAAHIDANLAWPVIVPEYQHVMEL